MGLDTKSSDWQVCGILNAAGAEVLAAGLYVFDFFSQAANTTARFAFKGVGIGIGGDASGGVLPANLGPFTPWSSIHCDKPFSVWDLNGAWGRVTNAGYGMGVTFGIMYITAAPPWSMFEAFFHSQHVGGFGVGAGAAAVALVGSWRFKRVSHNIPAPDSSLA